MNKTRKLAAVPTAVAATCLLGCADQLLLATPEQLNLIGPREDVRIVEVLPDTSFSVLRFGVDAPQCVVNFDTLERSQRMQVSDDRIFQLRSDGRLQAVRRTAFREGRAVRIWFGADGCGTLLAAALLDGRP